MSDPEILGALAGFVLAAMFTFVAVRQRYPRAASQIETAPPADLAPAEMAMLLRGTVGTGDIAATVIDLAIRGRLRIRELPRTARPEWELTTIPPPYAPGRNVHPFEGAVVSGLFGRNDRIRVSELAAKSTLHRVQGALDYEADRSGWFRSEPKHGRTIARLLAVLVVAAAVIVASVLLTTSSGLVGAAIVAAALGFAAVAWGWPRPSSHGEVLRSRIAAYRRFLSRQALGDEHLPYAIVLGHAGRWAGPAAGEWYKPASPDRALKRLRRALAGRFGKASADKVANGEGIDRTGEISGYV